MWRHPCDAQLGIKTKSLLDDELSLLWSAHSTQEPRLISCIDDFVIPDVYHNSTYHLLFKRATGAAASKPLSDVQRLRSDAQESQDAGLDSDVWIYAHNKAIPWQLHGIPL